MIKRLIGYLLIVSIEAAPRTMSILILEAPSDPVPVQTEVFDSEFLLCEAHLSI